MAKLLRRQKGGFFLDLAANEPVVLSNTRTLERDFGFKGICIEVNVALVCKPARSPQNQSHDAYGNVISGGCASARKKR